jgi:hypothetical protein
MPLCPQITNTPITVVLNSDFTVTSVVPVLPADTVQVNAAQADATAAQAAAATALAQANTAYTAAIGSLQPSANTIVNASNQMTAINGTGITVYSGASATSGARVVLNSTGLAGFNSSGTATFSVSASTGAAVFAGDVTGSIITGATLNIGGNAIINSSGFLTATGATITGAITATSGSFTGSIYASTGTIGGFTIGATNIQSGSLDIQSTGSIIGGNSSTLFYGYANIGGGSAGSERLIVTGNSNFNGTIISSSSITAQGELYAVFGGSNTVTNTANTWISSGGQIRRTTASSLRYKENVTDLVNVDELNPKRLLDLPVRAFTYKQEYLAATDDRYQQIFPGFISEEVDAIYPMAADYENGQVESWNDRLLLPGMLALIQDLYKEIATLKGE